jgi:hypothetical protein
MYRSCTRLIAASKVPGRIAALILGAVAMSSLDACDFLCLGSMGSHLSISTGSSQGAPAAGNRHKETTFILNEPSKRAFSFVRHDCIENFIVHGIRQDYVSTATDNKARWASTTLSGPALAMGNSLWGFVVKPTGRVVFGGIAAEGGMLAGTITMIAALGIDEMHGIFGKTAD